ncbi:hypothetical protein AFK68_31270 [Hydrocoleum sp. CS-953]|uniref:hypothetical protein n=1 Tax=Hydrocoleum sp. CS-953 TaxID=1671698 RepID=UPI000B9C6BAE|nr:hypothetical protein [Hydrocoleum sp. CS-953]OZH51396.1 hypothetical protein AFK68_31270 [Hydrocoleum sp. CS-953]
MKLLDNLFNWNPQLFREIKGRLKTRNVAIAISASLLCQFLVMMTSLAKLPEKYGADIVGYNQYCIQAGKYCTGIDWSHWWADIFVTFSWILFALTLLGGVYMLVADLIKEERLGTLNFLRLSPQSSQNILLGKLLGVPILIYLALAISLPLHLWAIISSGLSLFWFLGFYGILIVVCFFFYNASFLFVFLGGTQAWLATTIAGIFFWVIMAISQSYFDDFAFLGSGVGSPEIINVMHVIILGLLLGNYWIWQAVNRRYRNPNATVISKKQSYWLMGCFQVILLLFCFNIIIIGENLTEILEASLLFCCTINLFSFLLLIAFLSPQQQTLQDWARYRHLQVNNDETAILKGLTISLKEDLIWGEKSPPLVAIAINVVITGVILISGILLINGIILPAILTLILSLNLILIYAAITQLVLLMKVKNPKNWAVGILGSLITLPPIALSLLSITPGNSPNLWLLSTFPWLSFPNNSLAITPMLMTIIAHWSVLTLLTLQLTRKIQKLGVSDSQKLLIGQKD